MKYLIYLLGLFGVGALFYKIKDLLIELNLGRVTKQVSALTEAINKRQGKIDELTKDYERDLKEYDKNNTSNSNDPGDNVS